MTQKSRENDSEKMEKDSDKLKFGKRLENRKRSQKNKKMTQITVKKKTKKNRKKTLKGPKKQKHRSTRRALKNLISHLSFQLLNLFCTKFMVYI